MTQQKQHKQDKISLRVPQELNVDLEDILTRLDKGQGNSALNELMGKVYITSIKLRKFPESCTEDLINYCKRNSTFVDYLQAAQESGNIKLAESLYSAGMDFWKKLDDYDSQIKLSQAYIDSSLNLTKSLQKQ